MQTHLPEPARHHPPAWQVFLDHVHDLAQQNRFAPTVPGPAFADTEPAAHTAIPGLTVTEHACDDAITRRVFALLEEDRQQWAPEEDSCPPCNSDCRQGRDCPLRAQRGYDSEPRNADAADTTPPLLWFGIALVIGLTILLSSRYPMGWQQ